MAKKKSDNLSDDTYCFKPFKEDVKGVEKRMRLTGKDRSEVLREIVKAGLFHLRLTDAKLDPTHGLAKMKAIEANAEALKPTNNKLDEITKAVNELTIKTSESIRLNNQIDRQLTTTRETMIEMLIGQNKDLGEMFRNILVQRGLFYIYLLAYRAGTISEKRDIPEKEWVGFVNESIKLTSNMAANEIMNEKWEEIENQYIPNLAQEIFDLLRASRPKS